MSPRSSKPKSSRKPKAKPVIKKTVTTTQTGGISARAKKLKVQGDLVAGDKVMTARRDIVVNVASDQGAPKNPRSRSRNCGIPIATLLFSSIAISTCKVAEACSAEASRQARKSGRDSSPPLRSGSE